MTEISSYPARVVILHTVMVIDSKKAEVVPNNCYLTELIHLTDDLYISKLPDKSGRYLYYYFDELLKFFKKQKEAKRIIDYKLIYKSDE